MIHGTSIFSTADLRNESGKLLAKIKIDDDELDCDVMQDNSVYDENNLTSDIRIRFNNGSIEHRTVKTNLLYDFHHEKNVNW